MAWSIKFIQWKVRVVFFVHVFSVSCLYTLFTDSLWTQTIIVRSWDCIRCCHEEKKKEGKLFWGRRLTCIKWKVDFDLCSHILYRFKLKLNNYRLDLRALVMTSTREEMDLTGLQFVNTKVNGGELLFTCVTFCAKLYCS